MNNEENPSGQKECCEIFRCQSTDDSADLSGSQDDKGGRAAKLGVRLRLSKDNGGAGSRASQTMRAGLCTCAGMDAGFRPAAIHKRRGDATYDRGNSNMVEAYPDQQTMEGLEKDALPAFVS